MGRTRLSVCLSVCLYIFIFPSISISLALFYLSLYCRVEVCLADVTARRLIQKSDLIQSAASHGRRHRREKIGFWLTGSAASRRQVKLHGCPVHPVAVEAERPHACCACGRLPSGWGNCVTIFHSFAPCITTGSLRSFLYSIAVPRPFLSRYARWPGPVEAPDPSAGYCRCRVVAVATVCEQDWFERSPARSRRGVYRKLNSDSSYTRLLAPAVVRARTPILHSRLALSATAALNNPIAPATDDRPSDRQTVPSIVRPPLVFNDICWELAGRPARSRARARRKKAAGTAVPETTLRIEPERWTGAVGPPGRCCVPSRYGKPLLRAKTSDVPIAFLASARK